jgi:hypothetical protein
MSEEPAGQSPGGDATNRAQECCEAVREEIARLRACFARAWLLTARGCEEKATLAFADLYQMAAGISDQSWARDCCGAHEVVRSLCHLLDRGRCSEEKVLEAVAELINALEDTARRKSNRKQDCGQAALNWRLLEAFAHAGVVAPALLRPQKGRPGDANPAGAMPFLGGGI